METKRGKSSVESQLQTIRSKENMINGTEHVIGPRGLTKNQLIQLIVQTIGGWPSKAKHMSCFESADPKETVYRFVDEQGIAIETKKFRRLEAPLWTIVLTRDDFMLYFLSREAKQELTKQVKANLLLKIASAL